MSWPTPKVMRSAYSRPASTHSEAHRSRLDTRYSAEKHCGVEISGRVEGGLDRAHRRDVGLGARHRHVVALAGADAVFGADVAAAAGDQLHHRRVQLALAVAGEHTPQQIQVQVALADVTEKHGNRVG